jgi:hypothetical protein
VVDVGGGFGSAVAEIAHAFKGSQKNFCFVVQDREDVCNAATKAWEATQPDLLSSGIVTFEGMYLQFG